MTEPEAAAVYRRFGEAVRAHRYGLGLTTVELAARMSADWCSSGWIESVEAGEDHAGLRLHLAAATAAALGLTLVQLLQTAEGFR